jgi:hypothetical protein
LSGIPGVDYFQFGYYSLVSVWFQYGFTLVSLWFHFDFTLVSLWFHFGFTLVSLWLHFGFTLVSLWFHFGFTLVFRVKIMGGGSALVISVSTKRAAEDKLLLTLTRTGVNQCSC